MILRAVLVALSLRAVFAGSQCRFGIEQLWTSKLRDAPLTATPLLFDIDGDSYDDLVVPSFSGEVWGVHGENGHIVDNWPFYLEDRAFHASPLVYDVNSDGVLEFVLTTTDAEVVFVETDNNLVYGETIKVPPLRVKRAWHKESSEDMKESSKGAREAMKEGVVSLPSDDSDSKGKPHRAQRPSRPPPAHFTTPYSEFDSRHGRHADPLYSVHESAPRLSGVDPADADIVYVDPHVLATPLITDIDGDGVHSEMVVPVSYYFDSRHYGSPSNIARLNGLAAGELVNYVGGGVVVINLKSGKIIGQKLLGMTRATDNQPGFVLATPTVVRMSLAQAPMIAIGTAKGELHVLLADTLEEKAGFPLLLDSITAQVAVEDVFDGGHLDFLIGDYSGNVYCVDGNGVRVWERELGKSISTAVRVVDVDRDGEMEVVVTSMEGDVWLLDARSGKDRFPDVFPVHLGARTENSPVLLRIKNLAQSGNQSGETVAIVLGMSSGLYMVDVRDGCVHHVPVISSHVIHEVLAGDVDPYRPGLELISVGLDGTLVCYAMDVSGHHIHTESWSMEATGPLFFAHKSSSFFFRVNTSREVSGNAFHAEVVLYANRFKSDSKYNVSVSMGTLTELYWKEVTAVQRKTVYPLQLPAPDRPVTAVVTFRACNSHQQCRSLYSHVRFNLHFEDHLRWFLCLPFLSMCAVVLWVHWRDSASLSLPTSHAMFTSGTRKNL